MRTYVYRPDGVIEVLVTGADGPLVVMVASLGRGAADFAGLANRLAAAGYRAARPQPRGVAGSTAPLAGLSMSVLADDVAAVVAALAGPSRRATLVGHAFGGRVVRAVAADHPDAVDSLVLLCCGGADRPAPGLDRALRRVFDASLGEHERLRAVATAYFAPGNDPAAWADGWYPAVAAAQRAALRADAAEHWWPGGSAPILVVQPSGDVIDVPANAERLRADAGGRATVVTIPAAGHALLPEQPDLVAGAVLRWLGQRAPR